VVQRWRQGRPFRFVKEKFGSTNPKVEFGTAQGSEIRLRGTQGSRGSVGPVYADVRRQHYKPELKGFVVSPINAREQLSHLIKGTEKQLLIYDPEISDRAMIRLLGTAREGVKIRIIGQVTKPSAEFDSGRLMRMRFHTRTIVRDRPEAFLGGQSPREAELDRRCERGMIVRDRDVVRSPSRRSKATKLAWNRIARPPSRRRRGRKSAQEGSEGYRPGTSRGLRSLKTASSTLSARFRMMNCAAMNCGRTSRT